MTDVSKYARICTLLVSACTSSPEPVIVLTPTAEGTDAEVALVFVSGPDARAQYYAPLARVIRDSSAQTIWTSIVQVSSQDTSPAVVAEAVQNALELMEQMGMRTRRLFIAAHGSGGPIAQDYVAETPSVEGLILLASPITRARRHIPMHAPVLTVGGELDGVCRIFRLAEEFYHQQWSFEDPAHAAAKAPIVVLRGVSHLQFSSGQGTATAIAADLEPEVSLSEAHGMIAAVVVDFVRAQMDDDIAVTNRMMGRVAASAAMVEPLVASMVLEGSRFLRPPCSATDDDSSCWVGSAWAERAQTLMGGLPDVQINVSDAFFPVAQINPVHLPEIQTQCSEGVTPCLLHINTVSEAVYEEDDSEDNTYVPISAVEIRAKLMSRQSIHVAAGFTEARFEETDAQELHLCSMINREAWQWALENAGQTTLERFERQGARYVMGDDLGPYNMGPLWIWTPLDYSETTDAQGNAEYVVRSPTMATPMDFAIKAAAGFHYCKLLSPARAMEWIYVDSLRRPRRQGNAQ